MYPVVAGNTGLEACWAALSYGGYVLVVDYSNLSAALGVSPVEPP